MTDTLARRLAPEVRARIRSNRRRFKSKCSKYEPALARLMEQVFLHGPLEHAKANPEALKHPEFHDFFDDFVLAGTSFWDLSGQGRYHMTGDHAAIDEKPWRSTTMGEADVG